MPKKYTRKHFQKDLKKLANLIENYNSTSYMKGGAKKLDKNGNPIEYRTFRVVQEDGQSVSFGTYRINKNQPVGPEKAASKAARVICRRVRANGSDHRVCHGKTFMIQEKTRGSAGKVYGPYEIIVYKLTPAESKKRTQGLVDGLASRLVKSGMSKSAALKKARKDTRTVTHKVYAQKIHK